MIGGETIKFKGGGKREYMETGNINSLESSLKSYLLQVTMYASIKLYFPPITHIFFKDNKIICKGQINLQILIFLVPSCPSSHLLYILVYQKRKIVLVLHLGKHFSSNSRSQSLTRKKFKEFKFLLNFVRISQSCSDTIPTISKH